MRSRLESILITRSPTAIILAGLYVYWSRGNPYVVEIIIGSVAVSVLLGALSSLTQRFLDKRIESKPVMGGLLVVSCLSVLIATLVLSSNKPPSIRREITVTYLADSETRELASSSIYVHDSTTSSVCYMHARSIFKKFKEQKPQDANKIDLSLEESSHLWEGWKYFQNLSEYLIPDYVSGSFTTPEADRTRYHRETGDWFGLPDEKIRGKSITIESIAGDFKDNVFHGIKGEPWWDTKGGLALPKGTSVSLVREEGLTSKFIIKNKYLEIVIGARLLPMESQGIVLVDDSGLLPYASSKWEDVKEFKVFKTMIYYDVTFSRLRYAFPKMQYYERWANSLFSLLQRSFAWGNPPVLNDREVRRLIRQYQRQTKEE